jgi:pimeloyl-ACP methyl ester carboxylesterase
MRSQPMANDLSRQLTGTDARRQVLAGVPLGERRLRLAGVAAAVLEGGDGPPLVLLHGQGGWAAGWLPVIPDLLQAHRVVVPDLPGLGASETPEAPPDAATVLAWLGELIDATCTAPPVLVGASLGGSIAARFATGHSQQLARLVLVDTGCLVGRVRPALLRHSLRPSRRTMIRFLDDLGVGRRLPNLPLLVAKARAANRRILQVQRAGQGCAIGTATFERIQQPYAREGQRTGALRFGDHRAMAWPAPCA